MKHFGCLRDINFYETTEKEIVDILTNKGLFELSHRATGNPSDITDGILTLDADTTTVYAEPAQVLVDEFYSYIINTVFKYHIISDKLEFFNMFNNQIYGLDFVEQKKIALHHFNTIYQDVYLHAITPFTNSVSETGITHNYNFGRLQMLSYQLNAFKRNLIDKIKANKYLSGDSDFFTVENILKNYDIEPELNFEIWLQILVELNDRYQFEEDVYFTNIKFEKELYNKYKHIFKSFESLQFTNRKIKSFNVDKKAQIESLYDVLIRLELIKDHKKNFIAFLEKEYQITLSKIRRREVKDNYTHDKRVALFTQEWDDLAGEK